MALKDQLQKLASEKDTPCVTISLDTHRTHPDSIQDSIKFKNLLKEAEERVINEFGKRPVASLLEKIAAVTSEVDSNYNLDSLHVFLSNNTKEIVKLSWPTSNEGVHISDSFAIRSIIKSYNRSESYLVMVLSQGGVQLYEALNDGIVKEITNEDFPFSETPYYNKFPEKESDSKYMDKLIEEFFNTVDKALVKVYHETGLNCIVISTENNNVLLHQVANKPEIYTGHVAIDYNNSAPHQVVQQSWQIIKEQQSQRRAAAISEMKEAVGQGNVLTDLNDIYRAAIDGRGDVLIVHQDFAQAVLMNDDRNFDIIEDVNTPGAIDDITSNIAWEVLSKKGSVFFTSKEDIKDLGEIVLKTRY